MCPVICVNTILWLFFTFQLTILATVPPDWVKLVLKAMSYVTASFCIQFAIPPANCFFVFLLLIKLIKTVHSPQEKNSLLFDLLFNNGDRTQWSPIRSLIIRVIKPGGGGAWVFFGWVCAARDSKLATRSKKKSPKIDTAFWKWANFLYSIRQSL